MTEALDCAGKELRPDDLVVYVFTSKPIPGHLGSPVGMAWVTDVRSDNRVLVNSVAFMDLDNHPRHALWWHVGSRWMNPQCLRRMPPGFIHSLPAEIQQTLKNIHKNHVL